MQRADRERVPDPQRRRAVASPATADVLVYDAWASGDTAGSDELISGLRELHPDVPSW